MLFQERDSYVSNKKLLLRNKAKEASKNGNKITQNNVS